MNPLGFGLMLLWAAAQSTSVHAASADVYPNKPIRIVVPQPPGGSTDAVARLFAKKITDILGQQIVIDNRAAGGVASIATQSAVASANADGYTLLAIVPNFTFTPALTNDKRVRPQDFAPVTLLSREPYMLTVYPGLPAKSVQELVVLAKARPDSLNMGSGNIGSGTHMISMLFLTDAGIRNQVTYVPYKGVGLAFVDLMAGRLHLTVSSIVSAGPHVKSGRLRALGVTSAERSRAWPEMPTIAEQGLPGFDAIAWCGLVVPVKTALPLIDKLSRAAAEAAASSEVSSAINTLGGDAVGSTPAELRQLINREIPRWRALIKEIGMTGSMS